MPMRIFQRLCLLVLLLPVLPAVGQPPPMIAVGSFRNVDYQPHEHEHLFAAARDMTASVLVQKYDCRVCNRSSGYDAALEHDRKAMSDLVRQSRSIPQIQQADYVVGGLIRAKGADLECIIRACDLSDTNALVEEYTIVTNYLPALIARLPEYTANLLKLKTKPAKATPYPQQIDTNLTWVVLPFDVQDKTRSFQSGGDKFSFFEASPAEKELTGEVEQTLLHDHSVRLVDHNSLKDILQEHQLAWLNNQNGTEADTALAKLAGADRIIVGTAADMHGRWEVALSTVDAHNGVILGSVNAQYGSLSQLKNDIPQLCKRMITNLDPPTAFLAANEQQRLREAEFYLLQANIDRGPLTQVTPASFGETVMANCQAAYLLSRDDPVMVYRIASYLIDRIMRPGSWSGKPNRDGFRNARCYRSLFFDFAPGFSDAGKHRAARYARDMLTDMEHSRKTPSPSLQLARLAIYEKQYDEALQHVETHQANHPNRNKRSAKILLAKIYIEKRDYPAAQAIIDQLAADRVKTRETAAMQTLLAQHDDSPEQLLQTLEQPHVQNTMYDPDFYEQYIPLLRSLRGNQATLDYLLSREGNGLRYLVYHAELAYTYHLLGMTNEAFAEYRIMRQYDDLDNYYPPVNDAFTLENRTRPAFRAMGDIYGDTNTHYAVDDLFRLPAEIQSSTNLTLYLLPTLKVDSVFLDRISANVSKALGISVKQLSSVPADTNALNTAADAVKYQGCTLARSMIRAADIPKDAVFVICITGDHLCPEGIAEGQWFDDTDFANSDFTNYLAIATYRLWNDAWPDGNLLDYIIRQQSKIICSLFVRQLTGHECDHHACSVWVMGHRAGNKQPHRFYHYMRYGLCPDCQRRYRQSSLSDFHHRYQRHLQKQKQDRFFRVE